MNDTDAKPLGHVELPTGPYAVFPMNDVFLGYTFENEEYWETLRQIVNIAIDDFRSKFPNSIARPITGAIKVRTQFKQIVAKDPKKALSQDIQILEGDRDTSYTEFQIRAASKPKIEVRSIKYYGLGIGQGGNGHANQIWFLAEDVQSLLHGAPATNYVLKDEATGNAHPETSGMMYISLTKLSEEKSKAGELASLLLGKKTEFGDRDVQAIAKMLNKSFEGFKHDKEAVMMLSYEERKRLEGEAIGEARGEARGKAIGEARGKAMARSELANMAKELYEKGIDPNEIIHLIIRKGELGADATPANA